MLRKKDNKSYNDREKKVKSKEIKDFKKSDKKNKSDKYDFNENKEKKNKKEYKEKDKYSYKNKNSNNNADNSNEKYSKKIKKEIKKDKNWDTENNTNSKYTKKIHHKHDKPYKSDKFYKDDDRLDEGKKPRRRVSEINLPKRQRPVRAEVLELKNFKDSNRIDDGKPVRLNKYIANAGICSRREADNLIQSGAVSINGNIVTELGTKVNPGDTVQFGGETLISERKRYILLNKPKGYITTTEDPQERRTVMALVKDACKERVYPVGRLDRNTTGLLLFTNDGELAKKLTHPKHGAQKIYHVELDKPLTKNDMELIRQGIELDDGLIIVDEIAYIDENKNKKEIGIEIHSGKNRIIRRIFESLDYEVVKLDRVLFAGLSKKDISRGMWRFLNEKEIAFLKMLK